MSTVVFVVQMRIKELEDAVEEEREARLRVSHLVSVTAIVTYVVMYFMIIFRQVVKSEI